MKRIQRPIVRLNAKPMPISYSQRRESESEGEKANTETKKDLYKLYSAKTKINILKGY